MDLYWNCGGWIVSVIEVGVYVILNREARVIGVKYVRPADHGM